ncbi:MAG: hypothetical protein MUE72_06370 [Chitinophagaceae bacterium]|nr:hypothetical protein [Chitinophagaceae bacterium]
MKTLFILLPFLLIKIETYNQKGNRISIIGEAFNVKEGACVSSIKYGSYHIDSLQAWSNIYLGKKVIVTGILEFKTTKVDSNEPPVQNITRKIKVIKNARWRLYN